MSNNTVSMIAKKPISELKINGRVRKLYKYFTRYMDSPVGANLEWSLPTKNRPGKWMVQKGRLSMCNNGIHVATTTYLKSHGVNNSYYYYRVFEVEIKGNYLNGGTQKICCQKVRLVRELSQGQIRELLRDR